MQVLKKNRLEDVLNCLSQSAQVYVPMLRGPQTGFFTWQSYDEDIDDLMLDILNVNLPPKNIVLPQTEKMYSFKGGESLSIDEIYESIETKVIFGIRACDIKGIDHLDKVFLTKGFVDEFYKAHRDRTVIIANACYNPGNNCFCDSMEVSAADPESADVILREVEAGWVWEAKTPKGEEITQKITDFLETGDFELPEKRKFLRQVDYSGVAEKLKDMFDHPMWEKMSDPCQTCGICTYLCPTCYCFDIQVKSWGDEGYRFRCWDSCMYREYTQMAGGHNPREAATERFRNRFLHKLQFFNERYGAPLCTGCGRCIVVCPTGVSIIKIIDLIKEANASA